MNNKNILPADTYVVINKTLMHSSDRKILIMLYQPIIGNNAISLYFTLWSYLDKSEIISFNWTHHHLMSSMQMNMIDIIMSLEKLEAIGLVKTYLKEGEVNNYVYELYSPLSASEFLKNPILATTLYNNIGQIEYKKILEYNKLPTIDLKDYKNITTLFADVFEVQSIANIQNDIELRKARYLGLSFEPNIDLNTIFGLIPKEVLNYRAVTNNVRELICKVSFIYNFDNEIMENIIRNSINEKHLIDEEVFLANAKKYYQFENGNTLPSIVYKNQPEYLRKPLGDNSKKAKMIYMFETTSPYDFLMSKNGGVRLSSSDANILKILLIDMNFTPGVSNVLIDYILKINNNKLIKGFVETVAGQWKRSGVETVIDAMRLAEEEYKTKKRKVSNKNVKNIKPIWLHQEIEEDTATLEEQQQFLKKLGIKE